MPYDPNRHHRQSHRWRGYDYAQTGSYFITVCTQHRMSLFGDVTDQQVRLSDAGRMVEWWWFRLPEQFPAVEIDAFVVMPNHVHGVIEILPQDAGSVAVAEAAGVGDREGRHPGLPLHDAPSGGTGPGACPPVRLPDVVHWFKTLTTNDYIRGVKQHGWPPFPGRLWQRTYHDRVIRDDDELDRVRHYIEQNPTNWALDPDNPAEAPT